MNGTSNSREGLAKRTQKNPFKLKTPPMKKTKTLPSNQSTLLFASNKRSNSTLSFKSQPLSTTSESDLNRSNSMNQQESVKILERSRSFVSSGIQQPVIEIIDDDDLVELGSAPIKNASVPATRRPFSLISKRHTLGSEFASDDSDTDLFRERKQPTNLKNSKPLGSLLPNDSTLRSKLSRSASQLSESSDSRVGTQDRSILSQLGGASSQTQNSLSFNSKRKDPWGIRHVTARKNPRYEDGKVSKPNYDSASSSLLFKLSEEQQKVIDLVVEDNKSVFFTGSAGTGKSVILRQLVNRLRMKYGRNAVGVTASTGLAACNIGGITINKFAGVGIADKRAEELLNIVKRNTEVKEQWKRLKVLIIDEVSMLDGGFFDKLEYIAKRIRYSDAPFGGVQVVLTGDFFQLPPVPSRNGPKMKFCFEAKTWNSVIKKTILLKQVFRQKDPIFADLLNNLRVANITSEFAAEFKKLERPVEYEDGIGPTELFPTRAEVEYSNRRTLSSLKGEEVTFTALDSGNPKQLYLLENTMAPKTLVLKVGANVMMLKNKSETLVNGSVGKVVTFLSKSSFERIRSKIFGQDDHTLSQYYEILGKCCGNPDISKETEHFANSSSIGKSEYFKLIDFISRDPETRYPIVKFMNGHNFDFHCVEPDDFSVGNEEDGVSRRQIPLLLSWALSIHKSQGQTLDRVKVDLTRVFEAGQVYTALSRATSRERLQVVNFQTSKIHAHSIVKEFYQKLDSV